MSKAITVTISAAESRGIDAPTVDDFLGQVRDFVEVLRGVERAVESDGKAELIWRVTDATMNSPIRVELTPFGAGPAALIASRIDLVEQTARDGLRAIQSGHMRPAYFTDDVLGKARRIHERVLNGLATTKIDFGGEEQPLTIDRPAARELKQNLERATSARGVPYRELGSIEGFVTKPELDGNGRAVLRFRSRLDGAEIKAFASGDAFRQVERLTLSEVWDGVRVRVYGLIQYRSLGQVEQINANYIEVLDTETLPGIDDIVDPMFTDGLSTDDFLREQRGE